jgi:hypothetical protein
MKGIRFEVQGLPPAKSGRRLRWESLPSTPGESWSSWKPLVTRSITADSRDLGPGGYGLKWWFMRGRNEGWDATNYLGGISDVLEGKARRLIAHPGSLDHLKDLGPVGLYDDDRQIKEILYKEVPSASNRYVVTLSSLE